MNNKEPEEFKRHFHGTWVPVETSPQEEKHGRRLKDFRMDAISMVPDPPRHGKIQTPPRCHCGAQAIDKFGEGDYLCLDHAEEEGWIRQQADPILEEQIEAWLEKEYNKDREYYEFPLDAPISEETVEWLRTRFTGWKIDNNLVFTPK